MVQRMFLVFTLLIMLAWGFFPDRQAQARDLEQIVQSGELRACIVPVTPAYATFQDPSCREDCLVTGSVPRMVAAFAAFLDPEIRPVFHRLEWDEQFHDATGQTVRDAEYTPHYLETGFCDIYPTHLTKLAWRMKKMDIATLFLSRMMVITRLEQLSEFTSIQDLAGMAVGVALNTSLHTWVQEQNMNEFRDNPIRMQLIEPGAELESVLSGAADFTLLDVEVSLWESINRFQELGVAFPVGPVEEIGWGMHKENTELLGAVRRFFEEQTLNEASTLNSIWKEEFGLTLNQLRALIQATQ
ncbi:transglycosylase SLT domain-containing protein [Desulfonatronum parangueonense]